MRELFNISERFSRNLDEVRGPDRHKKHYLRQLKAWIEPSGSRRVAARVLGYGGLGLFIGVLGGVLGLRLFRNRSELIKAGSKRKELGELAA